MQARGQSAFLPKGQRVNTSGFAGPKLKGANALEEGLSRLVLHSAFKM